MRNILSVLVVLAILSPFGYNKYVEYTKEQERLKIVREIEEQRILKRQKALHVKKNKEMLKEKINLKFKKALEKEEADSFYGLGLRTSSYDNYLYWNKKVSEHSTKYAINYFPVEREGEEKHFEGLRLMQEKYDSSSNIEEKACIKFIMHVKLRGISYASVFSKHDRRNEVIDKYHKVNIDVTTSIIPAERELYYKGNVGNVLRDKYLKTSCGRDYVFYSLSTVMAGFGNNPDSGYTKAYNLLKLADRYSDLSGFEKRVYDYTELKVAIDSWIGCPNMDNGDVIDWNAKLNEKETIRSILLLLEKFKIYEIHRKSLDFYIKRLKMGKSIPYSYGYLCPPPDL